MGGLLLSSPERSSVGGGVVPGDSAGVGLLGAGGALVGCEVVCSCPGGVVV